MTKLKWSRAVLKRTTKREREIAKLFKEGRSVCSLAWDMHGKSSWSSVNFWRKAHRIEAILRKFVVVGLERGVRWEGSNYLLHSRKMKRMRRI